MTKEDFNEIVEDMLSMSYEGAKYHIYDLSKYRTLREQLNEGISEGVIIIKC